MFVKIGDIAQWLQIGATRAARPVLLYLHGGPGGTSLPAAGAWKPWDQYFTLVHWDQRGAGHTFGRNGEAGCGRLTIDRMVKDGIEVAEYLTSVLRQPRILLIGHSWGSVLAIHMLRRRPDLFWAYVGTGQVVNMRRNEEHNYQRLLARAEQFEDGEALQIIRALGPPPYPDRSKLKTLLEWSDKLADGDGDPVQPRPTPPGTDFTAEDVPALMQGMQFSRNQLFEELSALDLASLGLDFKMPMFFFHGTADPVAPLELAEQYFQTISAPHKELVRFEGCHHFLVFNRPQDFLRKLVERVYPYLGLQ